MAEPSHSDDHPDAPLAELSTRPYDIQADSASPTPPLRASADTLPHEPILTVFGRYQLLDLIDEGGMGTIYKAFDTELRREVALKMIRSGSRADAVEIERFQREASAIAQIRHPHVIEIYHSGYQEGRYFFTMPFLAGGNLSPRKRTTPLSTEQAIALMIKVARGVQAAHAKKILHRDLKPSNILLDEGGEPKVADFGLAKFLESDADRTLTQSFLGTPAYSAPELLRLPPQPPSVESDIWSMGVMLYEILSGQRPFQGRNNERIAYQVQNAAPTPLRELVKEVPAELDAIVGKCLRKSPAERYASAGALADDLEKWQKGLRVIIPPESLRARAGRWIRRHRTWLAATACMAIATGLAAAIHWMPTQAASNAVKEITDEEWIREVNGNLANGDTQVILDSKGKLPWHRWIYGEAALNSTGGKDPYVTLDSAGLALLEIVPQVDCPAYELTIRYRREAFTDGKIGLYVLRGSARSFFGEMNCFVDFYDFQEDRREVMEFKPLQLFGPDSRTIGLNELPMPIVNFNEPIDAIDPADGHGSWRELRLKVTPGEVEAFALGKRIGAIDRDLMKKKANEFQLMAEDVQKLPKGSMAANFHKGSGLGIVISQAKASFSAIELKPCSP